MVLRPFGRRGAFRSGLGRRRVFPRWTSSRLPRSKSLVGLLILLGLLGVLSRLGDRRVWPPGPIGPTRSSAVQVGRVLDGDTFELWDGVRVRLIGVDTPELGRPGQPPEPFSREAALFTEQFLASGPVRLEEDPKERQDRYGRRLAYVWVGDRMLNEELLRAGLARARLEFGYSEAMKMRFAFLEQEARQERRGLWASLPP